ncbi:unnamed protein product [Clonostachys rhizophaga]|uniref:Uncharacterized protein n=1 Tax=Clonostachys rhizophaga TaxID=160324 RepID=A0A9N9VIV7_9HYPO|nr:unnamed protein product [Clonostachys rhizophaga]
MPPPPPPLLDPVRDGPPRHPLADEVHRDPQRLRVPVPRLVVEEEHVLRLHVPHLGPRVDLRPAVEGVEGPALPALGSQRKVEQLEQVAGERGRRGARGDGELGAVGGPQVREGVEDGGDVGVECEGLAEAVCGGGGVLGGGWLEGRGDVAVDPEGPEGVVEVEDDELWEGQGRVAEGRGEGFEGCGEGGRGRSWCGGAGEAPGHREGGLSVLCVEMMLVGLFIGEMIWFVFVWWGFRGTIATRWGISDWRLGLWQGC